MLVRGMIGHIIENDMQAARMGLLQQPIKGCQIPEERINTQVISDIIATIRHWRRIEGREPECINAQHLAQVIQALDDSGQITNPISIAILKTTQIDLVNHALLPPGRLRREASLEPHYMRFYQGKDLHECFLR